MLKHVKSKSKSLKVKKKTPIKEKRRRKLRNVEKNATYNLGVIEIMKIVCVCMHNENKIFV